MINIQIWNPDDVQIVAKFVKTLALVFPESNHTIENFLWKHQQNPLGPSIVTYVQSESGEIAAIRGFWRCPLNYQDKQITAYQPCDTATHINNRRQGLFKATTNYALKVAKENNCQLVFNFPVPASKAGYLKLGWQDVGGLLAFVKPVNKLKVAYFLIKNKRISSYKFVQLDSKLDSFEDHKGSLGFLNDISKDQGFSEPNLIYGMKSYGYLKWRFFDNPRWHYIFKTYKNTFMIAKIGQRASLKELTIVCIHANFDQYLKESINFMLDDIIQQYSVDFISYYIHKDHPFANIFLRSGFFKFPTRANFVVLPINNQISLDNIKWAIQCGDMDTF